MISCNVIMSVIINAKVVLMRYNFLYCLCLHLAGSKKIIFIRRSWRGRMKVANFSWTTIQQPRPWT